MGMLFFHAATRAQPDLTTWLRGMESRQGQIDFVAFQMDHPDAYSQARSTPSLREAIPALDALEEDLQPWGNDKALENRCMQALLADDAKHLHALNVLRGLYRGATLSALDREALSSSFEFLPAMLHQWDHAAARQDQFAGMWHLSAAEAAEAGLIISDQIDERFVPEAAARAAVAKLNKLQRRFPDSPARVLVGYVKGMAYATRWSGAPGYDKSLDEWLAMYKVVSRLLVNLDLEDTSYDWIETISSWQVVKCSGIVNRTELRASLGRNEAEVIQCLPWWTGEQVECSNLQAYGGRIAPSIRAQHVSAAPAPAPAPQDVQVATADYVAAFTCELHEVKAGDTLWNISKRYPGTTPEWIAEINEITDYIRVGQVLCIPKSP